jgi:hypothetical protein
MGQINNISFSVTFNLNSTPTLVLTDTTASAPTGLVGIFSITQPDGYTRTGNLSSPDISIGGGAFSIPLRLDSTGNVQMGEYVIKYTASAPSYLSTDFSRTFQFSYEPSSLVLNEDFDVFTPSLKYTDNTNYQASGFNSGAVTRQWTAVSIPTGTITSTSQIFDIVKSGKYYDASYVITLSSAVTYVHQVYTYLSVIETIAKTINTYAQAPPSLNTVVARISDLKSIVDGLVNTTYSYENAKADFESAQTFFTHIIDKLKVGNKTNIFKDLKDLILILNNRQTPAYTATNLPILAYDINDFAGSPTWGRIIGDISNQPDLWNYIQLFTKRDNYIFDKQVASATWVILHNMGKFPSVTIVDTANDEIDAEVKHNSNTQLTITFSAPVSGKAYLN